MKLAGIVVLSLAAFGQEFEVASVKASKGAVDRVSVGVRIDGAQVHISDYSLQDYVRTAYRVKLYQVIGPDTLSDRFNVDAKLPEGATRDQVPEMLQALLAGRFEMKIHRESREFPVYALSVPSGGVKLKQSAEDGSMPAPATNVSVGGGANGVSVNIGNGSSFTFADAKLDARKVTMANFADTLSRFTDRPIVDRTGLTGSYDISIQLTPEDYRAMLIQSAVTAGVKLPPQALQLLDGARADSLHSGLRNLGLQLTPTKAPIEVIVVDHISKSPVEN